MIQSNCKRNYRHKRGNPLGNFSSNFKAGIFNNETVFTNPPVTEVLLDTILTNFLDKYSAYKHGGKDHKLAYENAMKALKVLLNKLANFVDEVANGNITVIKMSGFEATFDPNVNQKSSSEIMGVSLQREPLTVGSLISNCDFYLPKTNYLAILTEGVPLPKGIIVESDIDQTIILPPNIGNKVFIKISKQRKKYWKNLISGTTYYVYYIAIARKIVTHISKAVEMIP